MIGTAVTKLQLVGLTAQGLPENLMAHADAKNETPTKQVLDRLRDHFNIGRIAGTVGQKYSVRIVGTNTIRGGRGRKEPNLLAARDEFAQRICLASQINCGDFRPFWIFSEDYFFKVFFIALVIYSGISFVPVVRRTKGRKLRLGIGMVNNNMKSY